MIWITNCDMTDLNHGSNSFYVALKVKVEKFILEPLGQTCGHLSLQLLHVLVTRSDEVPLENLEKSLEMVTNSKKVLRWQMFKVAHLQCLLFLDPLLFPIGNKDEDGTRFVLFILCTSLNWRFLTHNTLKGQENNHYTQSLKFCYFMLTSSLICFSLVKGLNYESC